MASWTEKNKPSPESVAAVNSMAAHTKAILRPFCWLITQSIQMFRAYVMCVIGGYMMIGEDMVDKGEDRTVITKYLQSVDTTLTAIFGDTWVMPTTRGASSTRKGSKIYENRPVQQQLIALLAEMNSGNDGWLKYSCIKTRSRSAPANFPWFELMLDKRPFMDLLPVIVGAYNLSTEKKTEMCQLVGVDSKFQPSSSFMLCRDLPADRANGNHGGWSEAIDAGATRLYTCDRIAAESEIKEAGITLNIAAMIASSRTTSATTSAEVATAATSASTRRTRARAETAEDLDAANEETIANTKKAKTGTSNKPKGELTGTKDGKQKPKPKSDAGGEKIKDERDDDFRKVPKSIADGRKRFTTFSTTLSQKCREGPTGPIGIKELMRVAHVVDAAWKEFKQKLATNAETKALWEEAQKRHVDLEVEYDKAYSYLEEIRHGASAAPRTPGSPLTAAVQYKVLKGDCLGPGKCHAYTKHQPEPICEYKSFNEFMANVMLVAPKDNNRVELANVKRSYVEFCGSFPADHWPSTTSKSAVAKVLWKQIEKWTCRMGGSRSFVWGFIKDGEGVKFKHGKSPADFRTQYGIQQVPIDDMELQSFAEEEEDE